MMTWILRTCAILFSLLMLRGAWQGHSRDAAFADHGRRAVILPLRNYTDRTTVTTRVGVEVNRETKHEAFITYRTADNRVMRKAMVVPDSILARINAGESVLVQYLPEDPEVARFAGAPSGTGTLFTLGAVITALTAIFWRKM